MRCVGRTVAPLGSVGQRRFATPPYEPAVNFFHKNLTPWGTATCAGCAAFGGRSGQIGRLTSVTGGFTLLLVRSPDIGLQSHSDPYR